MNGTPELNDLSVDQFRSLSCSYVRKAFFGLGAKVEFALAKNLDFVVRMPNGERWGVVYQCYRIFNHGLQRTFTVKNQSDLQRICSANELIPVFACTVATSDEPNKIQVIITKLADLFSIVNNGSICWLRYSDKHGIVLRFNLNKDYLKEIKSNPDILYVVYTL